MAYWYNSSKPIVMRKHFEPLKSVFACYVAIINYCILAQIVFLLLRDCFLMIYFLYVIKNFFETDYFSPVRFQKPFCEKERERDRRKKMQQLPWLLAVLYDFVR